MSYEILYRSLFVKTRDSKYIAIVEMGSNNVCDCLGGRRARDWQDWRHTAEKPLTATELMGKVEDSINYIKNSHVGKPIPDYDGGNGTMCYTDADVERRYSYFSAITITGRTRRWCTAQEIRNFFKRGIERAIDFGSIRLRVDWITECPNFEHRYPNTEEELTAALKEARSTRHEPWVSFADNSEVEDILLRQKMDCRIKRVKNEMERTSGYVVYISGDYAGGYITRCTPRQFKFSWGLNDAHVYSTYSAAKKVYDRIIHANHGSEIFKVAKEGARWKRVDKVA